MACEEASDVIIWLPFITAAIPSIEFDDVEGKTIQCRESRKQEEQECIALQFIKEIRKSSR